MKTKMLLILSIFMLAIGLASNSAFAISWFPPVTAFQDADLDFVDDADRNGTMSVGDRLYGVIEFVNTYRVIPAGAETPIAPQELTGVFDVTIVAIIPIGPFSQVVFGPTGAGSVLDPTAAPGTMISMYLDSVDDLDLDAVNCTNAGDCIDKANNGSLFMELGFAGDDDESWTALGPTASLNYAAIKAAPSTFKAGSINYFLSILTNNTGQTFLPQLCAPFCTPSGVAPDGYIDVIGSGDILGGQGLTNGATARSDTDAQVATVPEPSTLLLLGAGLLGLASIARRRTR